jgi:hypothetical protein
MNDVNIQKSKNINSIIWDNWEIVGLLSKTQNELKIKIIDAIENAITEEEQPVSNPSLETSKESSTRRSKIEGRVTNIQGSKVETRFYLVQPTEDVEDVEEVSLSIISIEFPTGKDGGVSLEISANLPFMKVFDASKEYSKQYIRNKVEALVNSDGALNIADLNRASGKNPIAKRIVKASAFSADGTEQSIEDFVQSVMEIYTIYKQIPRWLAESNRNAE